MYSSSFFTLSQNTWAIFRSVKCMVRYALRAFGVISELLIPQGNWWPGCLIGTRLLVASRLYRPFL
jgi:hypothetical protein